MMAATTRPHASLLDDLDAPSLDFDLDLPSDLPLAFGLFQDRVRG